MPLNSSINSSFDETLWQPHKPYLLATPSLNFSDINHARQYLRAYFLNTFDTYESLFQCLRNDEAYYVKPISLRHPLIFYFGHTAIFFINKLLLSKLIPNRLNPHFESMFAVGVDEMSWDDLNDQHYDWPSVEAVREYRGQVRALVLNIIEHAALSLPIDWHHPWWAIIMCIEHERIHLETSSVLIRQHNLKYVYNHPKWQAHVHTGNAPKNQWIDVAACNLDLNKTFQSSYYGWDNEYGRHQAEVAPFQASQYLASNHEFLAFVQDEGYQHDPYWSEEGLAWKYFTQAQYPTFWRLTPQGWTLRLMLEEIPMPWNWPVEVNYHEAHAFCQWKSKQTQQSIRLPTEDEWYAIYQHSGLDAQAAVPKSANIALNHATHTCPVDQFKHGDFYDVQGNVWQWTETVIYPFEGFEVHPIYDDFSTPTFDGRHNLMKGGSWISAGNEALYSARYAFRRHFFQHAGFRYICAEAMTQNFHSQYETDVIVSQYLDFQYGSSYFDIDNFAHRLVQLLMQHMHDTSHHKALDLGCATGRASFELARYFDMVTGLDFSARFIQQASALGRGETIHYSVPVEGELVDYQSCSLKNFDLSAFANKVEFYQADACNLKPQFAEYDVILAANLIDRLHHPKDFLSNIHERLNIGGILMLTSPYTWLEEHTPRTEWIGGFKQDGENLNTLDGLHILLDPHFELMITPIDVPFVIRETARKFQHTLSQVTLWRRKI